MREIKAEEIAATVDGLFLKANYYLPDDVLAALKKAVLAEESPAAKEALGCLIENSAIAIAEQIPLCQDCGVAVVFIDLGQDVHITGGDLHAAINTGVTRAYKEGYLRRSMVNQPFSARINTLDNTPAVVYIDIVPGEKIKISVIPKGGGAENMSRLAMLTPAAGRQGIIDFVIKTVDEAGANSCPPVIVGVGIGGTAEKAMLLAKRALLRNVGTASLDLETAALEKDLLAQINNLGIGTLGYGGRITALAVNVEVFPAHIASLPVAVNIGCHSTRHKEAEI